MVLPAHDLRCHVAGRATGLLRVVWIPDASNAKIGDPQVAFLIENQIFRFDIAMQDGLVVHVLERVDDASCEEACLLLAETTMPRYMITKITTTQHVHH